jgi:hypothetical protein
LTAEKPFGVVAITVGNLAGCYYVAGQAVVYGRSRRDLPRALGCTKGNLGNTKKRALAKRRHCLLNLGFKCEGPKHAA